jgi:trans-aconitate 2-methyltransferase
MSRSVSTVEWDARAYHRLSNPHVSWGERVLERLPLRGDETVIDAGCGTGRLTERLLERLPRGNVVALDRSPAMIEQARTNLARFGDRVTFHCCDLLALPEELRADAIFSTATLHWVLDHDRLFRALFAVLRPGGWLVAQCGGEGNLAEIRARGDAHFRAPPLAQFFEGWDGPWEFADPQTTADRLLRAGFVDIETKLLDAPTPFADADEYRAFLGQVVLATYLDRIPGENERAAVLDRLVEAARHDDPPLTLDYVRLDLRARRPS